jgi:predicted PurR-regulated permease PerM
MFESKYFRIAIWILVLFSIVLLSTHITFIFKPLVVLAETFFFPILLSGLFYFMLAPLVNKLYKHRVPKTLSILIIYALAGGLIALVVILLGPVLYREIADIIENSPVFINDLQEKLMSIQNSLIFQRLINAGAYSPETLAASFSEYLGSSLTSIGNNIMSFTVFVTNFVIGLVLVPFILFYMLKDGTQIPIFITRSIPKQHTNDALNILKDMHEILGNYIKGQITVSLIVGLLLYIGYLIIRLDYALLLAVVALITNIVPFIGPIIGSIPALIIALLSSPLSALYTLILIIVVQQVESLYISPKIMGSKLSIHPVSIIFIILFAGRFAGFWGIILAVHCECSGQIDKRC